jgi:hypothetical protein
MIDSMSGENLRVLLIGSTGVVGEHVLRLSVVRVFGTFDLTEHRRALAHLVQVMPLGRDGSSGGFGWSVS